MQTDLVRVAYHAHFMYVLRIISIFCVFSQAIAMNQEQNTMQGNYMLKT